MKQVVKSKDSLRAEAKINNWSNRDAIPLHICLI